MVIQSNSILDDMNGPYIFSLLPHILVLKVQIHDRNHDVHLSKFTFKTKT